MYTEIDYLKDTYPHLLNSTAFVSLFTSKHSHEIKKEFAQKLIKYLDTPKIANTTKTFHTIKFPYSTEIPDFVTTEKNKKDFVKHVNRQLAIWKEGKFRKTIDGDYKCGNMYFHKYHKYPYYSESEAIELTSRYYTERIKELENELKRQKY